MRHLTILFLVVITIILLQTGCYGGSTSEQVSVLEEESQSKFNSCITGYEEQPEYDVFGCGNIYAYRFLSLDELIAVRVDPTVVVITNQCQDYDILSAGIEITYEKSRNHPDSVYLDYCNDVVISNMGKPIITPITSGSMRIVSSIDSVKNDSYDFLVSIMLSDITFTYNHRDTTLSNLLLYKIPQVWP